MANTPAKHTPGPWTADIEGANANSVSILGPDPRLEVATIINDGEDLTDTDLANARLIAAAPAMLEALEDAARDCGLEASCASKRDDDHALKAWAELQNKLDAAIRLAKGEL